MKEKHNHRSRRDYFGPLLLITIGLIFLASNLGIIPGNGWSAIWRLWPLLLIIAGINDLIRGEGIVWPLLLVGVGGFILVNNYFQGDWISWSNLLQLWPVILIAIGIDLIFKEKTVWTALIGILLILVFLGGGYWIMMGGSLSSPGSQSVKSDLEPGMREAEISLKQNAGQIVLRESLSEEILLEGNLSSGSYQIMDDTFESGAVYEIEEAGFSSYPGSNIWELDLNPGIPLDLVIDNGAGELILSLEKLLLSSLSINQGFGRIVLDLPSEEIADTRIAQAVGQMNISVPEDLDVVFVVEKGLSAAEYPEGYQKRGNRVYSPGVDENDLAIEIVLEQAVGQIIIRYSR